MRRTAAGFWTDQWEAILNDLSTRRIQMVNMDQFLCISHIPTARLAELVKAVDSRPEYLNSVNGIPTGVTRTRSNRVPCIFFGLSILLHTVVAPFSSS